MYDENRARHAVRMAARALRVGETRAAKWIAQGDYVKADRARCRAAATAMRWLQPHS